MNKDPESWAKVRPDAFLGGSIVQARNVIEMAVHDIARQADEIERLHRILQWCRPRLKSAQYRALLDDQIFHPREPDDAHVVQSMARSER